MVREWLARFGDVDDVHPALDGTTGWRFVVEEIERAGHHADLADPAATAAKRGGKRRAKTDRLLRRCRPPLRPRRHRALVGPHARARAPFAGRAAAVALGVARGGAAGGSLRLTGLRVLPAGGATDRPQPGLPIRRAQALSTCYQILRELGDDALAPTEPEPHAEEVVAAAA